MQFDKARLAAAVDAAIAAERKQHDRAALQRQLDYDESEDNWLALHKDEWLAALPKIRALLKKDNALRITDVPHHTVTRYNDQQEHFAALFTSLAPRDVAAFSPSSDLRVIKAALDVLDEEKITDSALVRLGVRSSTLRTLFDRMPLEARDA